MDKKRQVEQALEEFAAMIIGQGKGHFDTYVNKICDLFELNGRCARCDYANTPGGKVCMICLGG